MNNTQDIEQNIEQNIESELMNKHMEAHNEKLYEEQVSDRARSKWRSPRLWAALGLLVVGAIGALWAGRYVQTVYAQATSLPPFTRTQFTMKSPAPTANQQFGYAFAMERSGGENYAIVGASGEMTGTAYVWEQLSSTGENNGRDWRIDKEPNMGGTVVGVLTGNDTANGDQFGRAVAISRNFAVVGAPAHDQPAADAGAAYLFDRLDTKQPDAASKVPWSQVFKLSAPDLVAGDAFGASVDVWGEDDTMMLDSLGRAVVGAPNKNGSAGAAYVYIFNTTAPAPAATPLLPTNPALAAGDLFGSAVAIHDNRAFVGAPGANSGQGAVYVFDVTTGAQIGDALQAPDGVAGDQFGWQIDVAENGSSLAIGAKGVDLDSAPDAGAVYIVNGAAYSFAPRLTASNFSANAEFGYSVAFGRGNNFTRNGLIIGAPGRADGAASSAYYFRLNGGTWTEYRELDVLTLDDSSLYGQGVGFVSNRIGVSAPGFDTGAEDNRIENAGQAYIYNVGMGTLEVAKNVEPDAPTTNWDIVINGASPSNVTLMGDSTTGPNEVLNGLYIISENPGADTDGDLYTQSYSCTVTEAGQQPVTFNSDPDGDPSDIAVRVNAGANVVCTFTNTLNSTTPTSLRVIKDVVPDNSNTNWNIAVSGPTSFNETLSGDGGTTPQGVTPGSYTISEEAGAETNADLYDSQYSCVADGAELVSGTGRALEVTVADGQNVECTFTNVRKPTLQIIKNVVPNGDTSSWLFNVEGPTPLTATLADDGDTGKQIVASGSYTIGETAGSGTDAGQYNSSYACTADGEQIATGETAEATVAIAQSQDVICRFTNTSVNATVGTLVIEKNVVPNDDNSTWTFTVDGATSSALTLQGDGDSESLELAPGAYTITETDGGDANLDDYTTSYSCSNGEQGDGREALVSVNAGDVVSCVFTNSNETVPPTPTPLPGSTPTATPVPPTATPVVPTATPTTGTPGPGPSTPTATPVPPTATPGPGTPTATPTRAPGESRNLYLPLISKQP